MKIPLNWMRQNKQVRQQLWTVPATLQRHFPARQDALRSLWLFCACWSGCSGMIAGAGLAQWLCIPEMSGALLAVPITWIQYHAYKNLLPAAVNCSLRWRHALWLLVLLLMMALAIPAGFGLLAEAAMLPPGTADSGFVWKPLYFEAWEAPEQFNSAGISGLALLVTSTLFMAVFSLFPLVTAVRLACRPLARAINLIQSSAHE